MLPQVVRHSITAFAIVLAAGIFTTVSAQTVYDVNAAFLDNETPNGTQVNPFGQFTYGYSLTPSVPGSFTTAGLVHTDAFNGNVGIEGYYIPNNIIVPAVLQNTTGAPIATNFVPIVDPLELLLHPGGIADGFAAPYADAIVRFTVPTNGIYDIEGVFRSLQAGGPVDSRVLLNGIALASVGDEGPFSILNQQLAAGDVIDFAVGAAGGIGADSTGLRATITQAAVPEPSAMLSWACCIVIAVAVGWCCQNRRATKCASAGQQHATAAFNNSIA